MISASGSMPVIPQRYSAQLSEVVKYNDVYWLFRFELLSPNRLVFRAGQYILLDVPGSPIRKSYSIASTPAVDHSIELLVDMRPQGEGTRYLGGLELGAQITFLAPIGQFVVASGDKHESSVVLIATGAGIAPFKSMLEDLLVDQGDHRPITLFWGLRHETHLFWYEDFGLLAEQHATFTFSPCLSQPQSSDWPFSIGRVTDCLLAHTPQPGAGYYLCGGLPMIQDMKQVLAGLGANESQIHNEKFF